MRFSGLVRNIAFHRRTASRFSLRERGIIVRSHSGDGGPAVHVVIKNRRTGRCGLPMNTRLVISGNARIGTNRIVIGVPETVNGSNSVAKNLPQIARLFRTHGPSGPTIMTRVGNRIRVNGGGHNGHRVVVGTRDNRRGHCLMPLSGRVLMRRGSCVHTNVPLSSNTVTPTSVLTVRKPVGIRRCVIGRVRRICHVRNIGVGSGRFRIVIHRVVHGIRVVSPNSAHFLPRRLISG